jgi:crossover junction endodeoxyribonuclease RusA|tara:strand:- start:960 stop:1337 length:378 start_codon:yes stop_codon:yes gene_type:complete
MTADKDYLIRLPWPPTKTSKNGSQGDFRGKAKAAKGYKTDCGKECMAQHVRRMGVEAVDVDVTFHPPSLRAYDLDNMLARCKQGLDAVAEAIGVDDAKWQSMALRRGSKVKNGCVLVHVKPGAVQ